MVKDVTLILQLAVRGRHDWLLHLQWQHQRSSIDWFVCITRKTRIKLGPRENSRIFFFTNIPNQGIKSIKGLQTLLRKNRWNLLARFRCYLHLSSGASHQIGPPSRSGCPRYRLPGSRTERNQVLSQKTRGLSEDTANYQGPLWQQDNFEKARHLDYDDEICKKMSPKII